MKVFALVVVLLYSFASFAVGNDVAMAMRRGADVRLELHVVDDLGFRDFTQSEIYDENGSAYLLSNNVFRWRVLSHGIPAESFATGATPVPKWNGGDTSKEGLGDDSSGVDARNVDMAKSFKSHRNDWIHSYFISAPLLDTYELFHRIVTEVNKGGE